MKLHEHSKNFGRAVRWPRDSAMNAATCLIALTFSIAALAGCAERRFPGEEPDRLPACMILPAFGWNNGHRELLLDPDGSSGRVCQCLTQEELDLKLKHDELNGQGLEECLHLASAYETNDCLEQYEDGEWLPIVIIALEGDSHWAANKGLACAEGKPGCSVAPGGGPRWPGLGVLLLVGLGLRRQRRTGTEHRADLGRPGPGRGPKISAILP